MAAQLGVVALFITNLAQAALRVNDILACHPDIIVGRVGLPFHQRGVSVVALVVDGEGGVVADMVRRLEALENVTVHSHTL